MPNAVAGVGAFGVGASMYNSSRNARSMDKMTQGQIDAMNRSSAIAEEKLKMSREMYDRYIDLYAPLEQEIINNAGMSGQEIEGNAQQAGNEVGTQMLKLGGARKRELTRMGISPNSGRYNGFDLSSMVRTAVEKARAINETRKSGKQADWMQKATALSLGKGLPMQAASVANSAGNTYNSLASQYQNMAKMFGNAASSDAQFGLRLGGAALDAGGDLGRFGENLLSLGGS